jgi:glycosyltransferase involved in cell wall biosynthesis
MTAYATARDKLKLPDLGGDAALPATGSVWLWPTKSDHVGFGKVAVRLTDEMTALGFPSEIVTYKGHRTREERTGPYLTVTYARHMAPGHLARHVLAQSSATAAWICADGSVLEPRAAENCRQAGLVITCSEASAASCRAAGIEATVIPAGITASKWRVPRRIGGPVRYVWRGSDPYRKGLDIFLRAFSELTGDVRAVVILRDDSEERRKYPDSRIDWVTGIFAQHEIADHLARCDIAVAPARSEGFNLCALEAMAVGLPLIFTAGTGMDDFASDAGIAVKAADFGPSYIDAGHWMEPAPKDVAAAMRMLGHDRGLVAKFGRTARERAADPRLRWSTIARDMLRLLSSKGLIQWP